MANIKKIFDQFLKKVFETKGCFFGHMGVLSGHKECMLILISMYQGVPAQ